MNNIEGFEVSALNKYSQPRYPTYDEARLDPTLLKKLPSRWKQNMGALACIGLLGMSTIFGGCSCVLNNETNPLNPKYPEYPNGPGYTNDNGNGYKNGNDNGNGYTNGNNNGYENGNNSNQPYFVIPTGGGFHFGGSGGPPVYVVYFTEQEALEVIKNKAEYLGLSMRDVPPDISVVVREWDSQWAPQHEIRLDLFNEKNNIAFAHVAGSNWWWSEEIARIAQDAFDAKDGDLAVGVFHGTTEGFFEQELIYDEWGEFYSTRSPTIEERKEIGKRLKQHLTAQVREIIEWLQAEGIIQ